MQNLLNLLEKNQLKCLIRLGSSFLVIIGSLMLIQPNLDDLMAKQVEQETTQAVIEDEGEVVPIQNEQEWLVVDIGGAVKRPGIYQLEIGARLADLIAVAGGFQAKVSDIYYLQRSLNMAEKLLDGKKYYVPYQNEMAQMAVDEGDKAQGQTGLVSVNQASLKTLMTLSGIGEARGQDMIDNRPYGALEELVSKGVITQKIFDDNKAKLSL